MKGFNTASQTVDVKVENTANGNVKLAVGQESTVVDVEAKFCSREY